MPHALRGFFVGEQCPPYGFALIGRVRIARLIRHSSMSNTEIFSFARARIWMQVSAALVLRACAAICATFPAFVAAVPLSLIFGSPDWQTLKPEIRRSFSDVTHITIDELKTKQTRGDKIVLLDARDKQEYLVSQLRGAISTPNEKSAMTAAAAAPSDALIVVYCSVGWRSAELVRKLQKGGVKNAVNLEGSIFEWANRGWPVYRGEAPVSSVKSVHPFSKKWGELLNPDLHAPSE